MQLQYLDYFGSDCTINRTPSVSARVSLKHSSTGTDPYMREHAFQGWISQSITSGETFTLGSDSYLIFSAESEGDAYFLTCRKTNCRISMLERTETADEFGVVTVTWTPKATSKPACGEIVTSALRQTEPGLLNTTVRLYYLPSSVEVALLSRLVHEMTQGEAVGMGAIYDPVYLGARFKVDSIDGLILPGIKRIQCSTDER